MSAYFCDKEAFDIATTAMVNDLRLAKKYISAEELSYINSMSVGQLYIALQNLNNYALAERYGIDSMETVDTNHITVNCNTEIQKVRILSTLRYQCSEGNAMKEELYEILDKYIEGLKKEFKLSDSDLY